MRLWRFTFIIRFIIFLFFLTFAIILPLTCWNLPFSRYYVRQKSTHTIDMAVKKDQSEGKQAYKYFSDIVLPKHSIDFYKDSFTQRNPKYAIGIITVSRHTVNKNSEIYTPQYLPRVVAKFDKLLKIFNRKDIVFFLCNAQSDPGEHDAALWLAKYVPAVHRKTTTTPHPQSKNSREQEKQDYVFCINHIRKFNATYSILVQDDALPSRQFLKDLDHIVKTRIENKYIRGRLKINMDKLASVKFYFPEKWEGYGTDSELILELIAISVLGGGILYAIFSMLSQTLTSCQSILLYSICSVYFGLLMFVIGRPYMLSLRMLSSDFYSIVGAPECCIPAVLYKTEYLAHLEKHLNGTTCSGTYPLDVAISRFFDRVSFKQYLVVPNLFDHIGVFSSLHRAPKDPHSFMT